MQKSSISVLLAALLLACSGFVFAQSGADAQVQESSEADETAVPAEDEPSDDDELVDDTAAPSTAGRASSDVTNPAVSLDEIRRFVSVFRAVEQAYVDGVEDDRLMRSAIRGLLLDLDPHSVYLEHDETEALGEQTSGAYDGLGLEVMQQPDRTLLIVAPIDDTPAARAGLKSGDVITSLDGQVLAERKDDDSIGELRGPPGSKVQLTIVREGRPEPFTVTLQRERIRVASVRGRELEPGYGYVRISMFQSDTGAELLRRLERIAAETPGPWAGLVLDLRSNPGGLLSAAVDVADAFLERGIVVTTRGRLPLSTSESRATPGDALAGAPIVVLVDPGTASAAEVVAGALRDQSRAVVLGEPTFGKGSVQTILPLDNGDAIKLTTARYYTPSGTSIQADGIVPDLQLRTTDASADGAVASPIIRERDLPGHLRNERSVEVQASEEGTPRTAAPIVLPPPSSDGTPSSADAAVDQALAYLKSLKAPGLRTPEATPNAREPIRVPATERPGENSRDKEAPVDPAPAPRRPPSDNKPS